MPLDARPRRGPDPPDDDTIAAGPRPPPIALVLAIDRSYRRRAQSGELRRIAPRRFNPRHEAWLPILHEDRDGWSFTALYSNTALAHQLHKTDDWVVVVFEHDHVHGQCTVVTEWRGRLAGRRVVRGREAACARHYAALDDAGSSAVIEPSQAPQRPARSSRPPRGSARRASKHGT